MFKTVKGDLFKNIPPKCCIIPHICNNIGAFSSGFVVPLGKYFPKAKSTYLDGMPWVLGDVQFVECGLTKVKIPNGFAYSNVRVANMIAQHGVGMQNGPPIRYISLLKCMDKVKRFAKLHRIDTIIAPKFGSCRAGAKWELIEEFIKEVWGDLDVTIFEL